MIECRMIWFPKSIAICKALEEKVYEVLLLGRRIETAHVRKITDSSLYRKFKWNIGSLYNSNSGFNTSNIFVIPLIVVTRYYFKVYATMISPKVHWRFSTLQSLFPNRIQISSA